MKQCLVCGKDLDPPQGRGRPPTTCSPKCRTARKVQQKVDARKLATKRTTPKHAHGTSTGATYYGCHCPKCRKWWRTYQRTRRAGIKAALAVQAGTAPAGAPTGGTP